MPRDYKITDEGIRFALKGFGNYQVVRIPGEITEQRRKMVARKPTRLEEALFNGVPKSNLVFWLDASQDSTLETYDDSEVLFHS